jgi:hypothetical protein
MIPRTERTGLRRPSDSYSPKRARVVSAALVAAMFALAGGDRAAATVLGGGGNKGTDCLAALDTPIVYSVARPRDVRCTDGDSSCDADGVVNGVCEFPLALCANSTFNPALCTLNGVQTINVDHAADNGDPRFDPEFQALQSRVLNDIGPPTTTPNDCTNATNFHVPITGPFAGRCKKGKKTLTITTVSTVIAGQVYVDRDRIKMLCVPPTGGCDPLLLYSGTFDRIQTQIFDRSCAVSGCHDSQSRTGDLLLETGASLTNLVNVTPHNVAAAAAGWKRVTVIAPGTGDPSTSLIVAKLNGPPPGFGARMPFNRRRLDHSLIQVIQLWVAAGAPDTGWVPGTDQ